MIETKMCYGCDTEKPLDKENFYFYSNSNKPMGVCRPCMAKRAEDKVGREKKCGKCKTTQPVTEYYVDSKTGRYRSYCKTCVIKGTKEYQITKRGPRKPNVRRPPGDPKEWTSKECKRCDKDLPISEFYFSKTKNEWTTYCKGCTVHINKDRNNKFGHKYKEAREVNKDERRIYSREYYEANAEKRYNDAISYNDKNREKIKLKNMQWRANHQEEYKAIMAVKTAIKKGSLVRPVTCELCSKTPEVKKMAAIHGHHQDYSYPLDVLWLCISCHKRLHGGDPDVTKGCEALWEIKLKDILAKKK